VLGIPVPSKIDLNGVTQQLGEAGKQFGKLAGEVRNVAGEVRAAREKAEQIGKILS
jgi:methyl-accepting chemotaxis protein